MKLQLGRKTTGGRPRLLASSLLVLAACTAPVETSSEEVVAPSEPREIVLPEDIDEPYTEQSDEARNARARLVGYFPNTRLISHEGQPVDFYDDLLVGKCVIINFMYTVCDGI